jgi:YggT family protein
MDGKRDTEARQQMWRDRSRPAEPNPPPADPESSHAAPTDPATPPEATTDPAVHDVERRTGVDRRVREEEVAEERRVAARRARDREAREKRHRAIDRVTLGVDYVFYLLYGLLGVRFVLSLLGAAETAGFVQFIHGVTNPFYAPFGGIVATPAINGGMLDFPIVIALLAYFLLHLAVRGLLRLLAGERAVA